MTRPAAHTATNLRDARSLRAYAHPIRMRLVGLLRIHGELTATEAARLLGESSGTASFHLRQLAKYGIVEEVDTPGRAKPWRATTQLTSWDEEDPDPETAAAGQALTNATGEWYINVIRDWLERRHSEPAGWRKSAWFGDLLLQMTPAELRKFSQQVEELAAPYRDRLTDPHPPKGSRPVTMLAFAVPQERP